RQIVNDPYRLDSRQRRGLGDQSRIEAPAAFLVVALQPQIKRGRNGVRRLKSEVQRKRVLQTPYHQHGTDHQNYGKRDLPGNNEVASAPPGESICRGVLEAWNQIDPYCLERRHQAKEERRRKGRCRRKAQDERVRLKRGLEGNIDIQTPGAEEPAGAERDAKSQQT